VDRVLEVPGERPLSRGLPALCFERFGEAGDTRGDLPGWLTGAVAAPAE
jgi:hypothetical protein